MERQDEPAIRGTGLATTETGWTNEAAANAAEAEAMASVGRLQVEQITRQDQKDAKRAVAETHQKAHQLVDDISKGLRPTPTTPSPSRVWRDRDEAEAAAKERASLEKIAKEMADIASTRRQERASSANPRQLEEEFSHI